MNNKDIEGKLLTLIWNLGPVPEAKKALRDYISKATKEARIAELEKLPGAYHKCNIKDVIAERLSSLKGVGGG